MSSVHATSEHVRSTPHRMHAPRERAAHHPASPRNPPPRALSALQLEQGVVTLPLTLTKAEPLIEIPFELPPGKAFLVAALSGGTGGAVLSIHRRDGTVLAGAQRVGLDNGTYKLYVLDLRAKDLGDVSSLYVEIGVTPKTSGFRNVKLAIIAGDFGRGPGHGSGLAVAAEVQAG